MPESSGLQVLAWRADPAVPEHFLAEFRVFRSPFRNRDFAPG
jgi:hypothetical protein